MSKKFLYGAAVQGIQSFIFQTNKLREIVGASELVEEICTTQFASVIYREQLKYEKAKELLNKDNNAILFAAGNIKYIFDSYDACQDVVRTFPKIVTGFAPGVTISQAVVQYDDQQLSFDKVVLNLEQRLRTQKNAKMRSTTLGLMGILRSRQTGLPVVKTIERNGKTDFWDEAQIAKLKVSSDTNSTHNNHSTTQKLCQKAFGHDYCNHKKSIAYEIEDITSNNDWIAIIHADGNGLGQIVQKIGSDPALFKQFSTLLDEATTAAAVTAYQNVESMFEDKAIIPIRPIVLGGDDLTIICRADLAIDYTKAFITSFEELTQKKLGAMLTSKQVFIDNSDHLTACAGIAYVKSSFPFHYAYNLAENLCAVAKKDTKAQLHEGELPKSCLMFHKLQDSFVEDWESIVQRELTPRDNISFAFGPYYISERKDSTKWLVEELLANADRLNSKDGNAVKSHLRQWMSLLHEDANMANQKLRRIKSIVKDMEAYVNKITTPCLVTRNNKEISLFPVYDILAIHTINTQKTK